MAMPSWHQLKMQFSISNKSNKDIEFNNKWPYQQDEVGYQQDEFKISIG